jgi:hypothetical protein
LALIMVAVILEAERNRPSCMCGTAQTLCQTTLTELVRRSLPRECDALLRLRIQRPSLSYESALANIKLFLNSIDCFHR